MEVGCIWHATHDKCEIACGGGGKSRHVRIHKDII